ncbi:MAG: glucose-methanol-choline oxidoreductase [Rhodospirillaceae bacterium]|nr:glucose-methanol-choline oxidoreductase [Rhodospirillaceae bacterium]
MPSIEYDYIIVGAGSAGCALAYRLAKYRPNHSILLLEAGGPDISPFIHVPAAIIKAIGNPSLDWMHAAEPDSSRNNKVDLWPAGKVLGGSSAINGMLYVRGQSQDYDRWAEAGCDGWAYADILPVFKRLESTIIGDGELRGREGPMHVNWLRTTHALAHEFVKAAQDSGLEFNVDYNGKYQSGVSYSQVTQKRGWRYHTARAYIWPGKKPSNIDVQTKAQVYKLDFNMGACTGLRFQKRGNAVVAKARQEVILSAGTFGSAKLLMLSGIGPGEVLKDVGVPVYRDIQSVGRNLQEHPEAMLSIEVNQSTYNTEINSYKMVLHTLNWFLFGRGPATSPYPHVVAFMESLPGQGFSDIQVQLGPYAFTFDENGVIPHKKPAISAAVNISYPKSRGRILLKSSNVSDSLLIEHELFGHDDDLRLLTSACKTVRSIFNNPVFDAHRIAERLPGKDVQSDDEWASFLKNTAFLGYHPVGTCRMGGDNSAVLEPNLKVRGVDRLRVADASIMPDLISGNTNATAIMIGEKAADLIMQDVSI